MAIPSFLKRNNPFSYIPWGLFSILIGLVFAAGLVEIINHERFIHFTSILKKPTTIAPVEAPQVSADSYAIFSLSSGKLLTSQNGKEVLPIASLTKLVTAVVALEYMPYAKIDIIPQDIAEEGNTGKLISGETFTTKEMLYPLLMVSSNDAAAALARHYGRVQFLEKMNTWAWSIGATNTAFVDPTGLSYRNVSNVEDMTKIITWIARNRPEIFNVTLLKTKDLRTHAWTNKTPFLNMSQYAGGKNGFTEEAQRTAIALFSYPELGKDFEKIAIIVLKSADRNKDTLALLHSLVVQ